MRATNSIFNFRNWLRYGENQYRGENRARLGTKTSELAKTDLEIGLSGPENPPEGLGTSGFGLRSPGLGERGADVFDDHRVRFLTSTRSYDFV